MEKTWRNNDFSWVKGCCDYTWNFIAKLNTTKRWFEEIKCTIEVKQGCPLSPIIFSIYIDKLKQCLEATGCDGPKLTGMVITLLLYVDDIVLLAKIHDDLEKQLRILHDYYSGMGMFVNINNTKVMIIKSKNINYDNVNYDKNYLDKVSLYKYLGIDIHHHLKWNYSIEKMIMGGRKAYY